MIIRPADLISTPIVDEKMSLAELQVTSHNFAFNLCIVNEAIELKQIEKWKNKVKMKNCSAIRVTV